MADAPNQVLQGIVCRLFFHHHHHGTLLHSDVNPTGLVLWIFCLILLIVTKT